MSAVLSTAFVDQVAQYIASLSSTAITKRLRLFTNNLIPSYSTLIGAFTECTLAGYSAINLDALTWTGGPTAGVSLYSIPLQTFTFSAYAGGVTVYGYYITNSTNAAWWWADVLATPYVVPAGGGSVGILLSESQRVLP